MAALEPKEKLEHTPDGYRLFLKNMFISEEWMGIMGTLTRGVMPDDEKLIFDKMKNIDKEYLAEVGIWLRALCPEEQLDLSKELIGSSPIKLLTNCTLL